MQKKIVHIVLALLMAYVFFRYLLDYLMPFILGLGIAIALEPLVKFLIKRGGFKRGLAAFVSILIFSLGAIGIGVWGVSALSKEATVFLENAPAFIAMLQDRLSDYPYYESTIAQLLAFAEEWLGAQSIRAVVLVPGLLIGIILVLLSAFFFIRDRDAIILLVSGWCPDVVKQYTQPVGKRLNLAAVGFLKSEFILFGMVAGIVIVGLFTLRQPYALMFGLIIALLDSLPIVGAGLVLWPWAAYMGLTGQYQIMAGLMVLYAIITVVRNVVGPKILGEQIDLHPLAAIMSIFIGVKAFGAAGILAGPALVIGVKTMFGIKLETI